MISSILNRKRQILLGTAILLSLAAQTAIADVQPGKPGGNAPSAKLAADARAALLHGDLRLAIIDLKNAVSADPRNAPVRAELAAVLLESGDAVSAERELRQARADHAPDQIVLPALFQVMLQRHEEQNLLDEFPDKNLSGPMVPDILRARALALQAQGHMPEAVAAMDRSLGLRRDLLGLLTRARMAQQQNDFAMANRLVDEAIQRAPNDTDAALYKISLQVNAGDDVHALDAANKLVGRFPNNLAVRLARIEILIRLNKDAPAKADVDFVLAKAPSIPLGIYYRALLMARAGDTKDAWRMVQVLPPEFTESQPQIGVMIAGMAEGAGDVETGAALLSAMVGKYPQDVSLRLRMAALRLRQNSPSGALTVLQPVKGTNDPKVLDMMAQIYMRMNQYDNALGIYQTMDSLNLGNSAVKRDVALLELRMGRRDDAIKELSDAVAKQPTDATLAIPLATALFQAQRYADALAVADHFGADPKNKVEALLMRANILSAQNNNADALAAYNQAIQLQPKNASALYARAGVLESAQRYPEATRDLRAILAFDAKNIPAFLRLAEIAARQGQDQVVRATLNQAVALAPKNPSPRVALADYLLQQKDDKGALIVASDFLNALPNNAQALSLKGLAQTGLGQKTDAVASFKQLTSVSPHDPAGFILLANALFIAGDHDGALKTANQAVAMAPDSLPMRSAQVTLQLASGDANGAIAAAQAFAVRLPSTQADLLAASTMVRAKHNDQAIALLTQSLKARPDNAVAAQLAQLVALSGDNKQAAQILSKWLSGHPKDIAIRNAYAAFLMQQNDNKAAAAQYEIILKQDPTNASALNNLGWMIQSDNPKRALDLLTKASQVAPNSSDVMDSLGWIKLQQKDVAGSLPLLTKARALQPNNGEIGYHLAVALYASNHQADAKSLLTGILAKGTPFMDRAAALKTAATWH